MARFSGPLSDIKVLEIAEGIAGPVCGLQLADLGANVIKIEGPKGDRARGWGPPFVGDMSAIFAHLNRGKRSLALNLTQGADRDALAGLLNEADVVILHMDPADRGCCGIDAARIAAEHPNLILCEITDLGDAGPFAGQPGSELAVQALAGLTRYAGSAQEPCRVGFEIASIGAGMHAVQAVLASLYRRSRDGDGEHCRVSLLGSLLSLKTILLAAQSDPDQWAGFHLNGPHWPPDIGWETADGQVTFDFRHGQREGWAAFCRAVGLDRLLDDPEYEDWRSTIYIGDRKQSHGGVYRPVFAAMTSAEASDLINGLGGISVKFHDYAELLAHPQIAHVDPFVMVGDARQVGTPFHFHGAMVADPAPQPAPALDDADGATGFKADRTVQRSAS